MKSSDHAWITGSSSEGRPLLDGRAVSAARPRLAHLLGSRVTRAEQQPQDRGMKIMSPGNDVVTGGAGKPDERYVRFLNVLRSNVEKLGIAETDRGLMTSAGLPGDLTRLLTLGGFPMRPIPSPDPFNGYRALASDFHSKDHERLAFELRTAMLSDWEPSQGYRIARVSTVGFPHFYFDIERKMMLAERMLRTAARIGELASKGDLLTLYGDHEVVLAYYATYRAQADGATISEDGSLDPKSRPVYGLSWATTDLSDIPRADKTIESTLPVFRQRIRLAYGLSGSVNYLLGSLMSGYRDVYLDRFSKTWVTKGPEDLQESISGWHIVGVDVSNFDSTYPEFLLRFFVEGLMEQFPDLASLLELTMYAPVYSQSRGPGEPSMWTGDPLDLRTFGTFTGLPSGVAYNPDAGKFGGTFQALTLLEDLFGGILGNVTSVLDGSHPDFRLKNSGDDMLIACRDPEHAKIVYAVLGDDDHKLHSRSYFKLETEDPITYLGSAVYADGPRSYRAEPSVNSLLVNWFCPEREAGSTFRAFPGVGWFEREKHFEKSRMYAEVAHIRDSVFSRYFGQTPGDMMHPLYLRERTLMGELSDADRRLLEKPERLHFTDDAKDSNFVADSLSAVVRASLIRENLLPLRKGNH